MKKLLALALSLTMLSALCVPSFAANPITDKAPAPDSSAIVRTDASDYDTTGGYYTVEFPAETTIKWSKTASSTVLACHVDSHLFSGKTLAVSVAPAGESALIATFDAQQKLPYTLNTAAFNQKTPVLQKAEWNPTVEISEAAWTAATLGTYEGHLTFTAAVEAIA